MTLEEARANMGRQVIYRDRRSHRTLVQAGNITGVNESFVFVRFGNDRTSQACPPSKLELVPEEHQPK